MKILLIGATAAGSGDAPLLLKRALEKENCQVRFISVDEDKSFWADVLFKATKRINSFTVSQFSRLVLLIAQEWKPDTVFLYGSNTWVSAQTIQAMQNKLGCKVVLWEVNNRCFEGYQAESIPFYDYIFVLDSYLVLSLRSSGARHVQHLCACIDPEEHFPIELSSSDVRRFNSDLCFIGSQYPNRIEILRNLTDYDLKIFGFGWGNDPLLARFISKEPVMDLTKLKIFSATRISLNIHGPHMIYGENFRVFEVAACGGVSFSLSKPDLLRCFKPNSEVVLFENLNDLHEKIDYYLACPDELKKIGIAARNRVLAEHTYAHRVKTILNCLGKA